MKAEIILLAVAMREEAQCALQVLYNVKCVRTGAFDMYTGQCNDGVVVLSRSGPGASKAAIAYNFARTNFIVKQVIVFGLAGAVAPELDTGAVVIPDRVAGAAQLGRPLALAPALYALPDAWQGRVWCGGLAVEVDRPCGRKEKTAIGHSGAVIVDMESYTLSKLARRDNIPVNIVRIVADELEFDMWPEPAGVPAPGLLAGPAGKLSGEVMRNFRAKAAIALDVGGRFLDDCLPALLVGQSDTFTGRRLVSPSVAGK